jgi:hypothetical protein
MVTESAVDKSIYNTAEKSLELDRRRDRVIKKWLSAFSIDEIATSELVTRKIIIQDLNIKRTELRELHENDVHELAAERIEGLRLLQRDAIYYNNLYPDKAPALLTVRLRAEETIAKIQGVLNEKVVHLGKIVHQVKLYDFEDNFPNAIVEGTSVIIAEPTVGSPLEEIIIEGATITASGIEVVKE